MDQPHVYEIVVEGLLTEAWRCWFEDLELTIQPGHRTQMWGELSDQSALYGVLSRIHSLNLVLVSVRRVD